LGTQVVLEKVPFRAIAGNMGAQACSEPSVAETKDTVKLNIYDLAGNRVIEQANKVFRTIGTGAFHAAIEVFGAEWSYGYTSEDTGLFPCDPKGCASHKYRESINLGETDLTEKEVGALIEKFAAEWQGNEYDVVFKNCTHFTKAFAEALHVKEVPKWVTSLAGAGATVDKGVKEAMVKGGEALDKAKAASIIAAAKAGKIDEEYKVRGKVQARAEELLIKAGEIEAKFELGKQAEKLANDMQGHATRLGGQIAGLFGGSPDKTASPSAAK